MSIHNSPGQKFFYRLNYINYRFRFFVHNLSHLRDFMLDNVSISMYKISVIQYFLEIRWNILLNRIFTADLMETRISEKKCIHLRYFNAEFPETRIFVPKIYLAFDFKFSSIIWRIWGDIVLDDVCMCDFEVEIAVI